MADTCLNCGAVLQGTFCHQCGQKHVAHRLNMPELISNAFKAVTELESSLWRTLRGLAVDPGRVALAYIGGHRAYYLSPVKFFLMAIALHLAFLSASGLLDFIADDAVHAARQHPNIQSLPEQVRFAFLEVLKHNLNLLFFTSLPLLAFAIRWQYWRAGRNYAETVSFMCYVAGISSLYAIAFVPLYYFTGIYANSMRWGVMLVMFAVGARVFFDMSWLKTVGGLFVSVFLYLVCTSIAGLGLAFIKMAGIL